MQSCFRSAAGAGLGSSSGVVQLSALHVCQQWLAVTTPGLSAFVYDVCDGIVPCWWYTSAVLFYCECKVGLCCTFVMLPGCIPLVRAINKDLSMVE